MIWAVHLLRASFFFFIKSILFILCSLKDSHNSFTQSLPLYTSWLLSMILNGDIKPDGICPLTFVLNEFSGLFLHPSIFSIKDSSSG